MKRMTFFVMALALVLGFTQCKKEQIEPQSESNDVHITLDLKKGGSNGSRVEVDPPHVTFEEGDQILVGYNNAYVGTLIHNGTRFEGNIDATVTGTQKLYFYFLGNKADVSSLTEGSSTTCTVNISDQANYPHLPVISMAPSNEDFDGQGTYTAHLLNKCSLMEFDVTSTSTAAICITGMNNQVTVNFDPTTADTDEGFSYSKDTEVGFMKLSGKDGDGKTYAIVLPQAELTTTGEAYTIDGYVGTRPALPALGTDEYYTSYTITMNNTPSAWDGDLAKLTNSSTPEYATARNGMTVYGTLAANVKVSIADGATVTLHDVNITNRREYCDWPGINCIGDATLVLEGTNTVCAGLEDDYSSSAPGIYIAENKTLIIRERGDGRLTAYSGEDEDDPWGAGIGAGVGMNCGNIVIESGTIIAGRVSQDGGAGIGSALYSTCGTIEIKGGTVTAIGGAHSAGIGSGYSFGSGFSCSCGNITINSGVTSVTATSVGSVNPIGAGYDGTCGTVTFDNVVMYNGSSWTTTPTNGGTYGGLSLAITTDEYDATTWTLTPYVAPSAPTGAVNGLFTINADGDQVWFSQGNLQATTTDNGSTWIWSFATNQYDTIGNAVANTAINGNGTVSTNGNGTVDLFGWSTAATVYGIHNSESDDYSGDFVDWGNNAIANGGNTANSGWRTLTKDEWVYLFNTRTDAASKKGLGKVNGVNGIILLPDEWTLPSGLTFTPVNNSWANVYTTEQWAQMEAGGAVFLPAAGNRQSTILLVGERGYYWSSTADGSTKSYLMVFAKGFVNPQHFAERYLGHCVRLVHDNN